MGLIKNLKALFVEEEQPETPDPTENAPVGQADPTLSPERKNDPDPEPQMDGGQLDQRILETLLAALEKNNQPGFDYLEFRQALRSLVKMNMDEPTRFQSAFAMAQTMKISPRDLIRTAQLYIGILDQEKKAFADALTNQEKNQVQSRKDRVDALQTEIATHQKEIESLMARIQQKRQEMETVKTELQDAHGKMEATRLNFMETHAFLSGEIREDVRKMEQYLK